MPERPPLSADHDEPTNRHSPALAVPPETLPSPGIVWREVGRTPTGSPASEKVPGGGPKLCRNECTWQLDAAKNTEAEAAIALTFPHPSGIRFAGLEVSAAPAPRAAAIVVVPYVATSEIVDHDAPARR